MDSTREDLPRVAVDTIHDWQRVKTNFTNAALSKLDARMVGNGSPNSDPLLQHMSQFIEKTFTIAQPNLRVNGRNLEDANENEQEVEPFDETLDRNIWSLSDKRLKWDQEVATKRRMKPKDVEASLKDLFEEQRGTETVDMDFESGRDSVEQSEIDPLEGRYPRMQEIIFNISAATDELCQSMPTQHERSDRIRDVTKEVKNLTP